MHCVCVYVCGAGAQQLSIVSERARVRVLWRPLARTGVCGGQVDSVARFGLPSEVRTVSGLDVYTVVYNLHHVHAPCYDGSETPFLLHLVALLWCVLRVAVPC